MLDLTAINNTIFFRKGREHAKIQMIILYGFLKLEEHMPKCTKTAKNVASNTKSNILFVQRPLARSSVQNIIEKC